jgi:hypothetical protein
VAQAHQFMPSPPDVRGFDSLRLDVFFPLEQGVDQRRIKCSHEGPQRSGTSGERRLGKHLSGVAAWP